MTRQGAFRFGAFLLLLATLGIAGFVAAAAASAPQVRTAHASCSSGYVDAIIGGQEKCLRNGEFCSAQYEPDYERYGFSCTGGHLTGYTAPQPPPSTTPTATTPPATTTTVPSTSAEMNTTPSVTATTTLVTTAAAVTGVTSTTTAPNLTTGVTDVRPPARVRVGRIIRVRRAVKHHRCTMGVRPDRGCSPGAYYSGLTKAVLCSPVFRTGSIREVPESEKHAVESEYGLAPRAYGSTLEIDHIISLELGGSNDIANLYPERAPGYHVKDKLENRLHNMVCDGQMTLRDAQEKIATDWVSLFRLVFGAPALKR